MTSNEKQNDAQAVGANNDPRVTTEVVIPKRPLYARVGLVVLILVGAMVLTMGLQLLRPQPETAEPEQIVARTTGMIAQKRDVQTVLRGYGTARAHRSTRIAPQISGVVIEINPRIESGNIVRGGDLLFRIDPSDFELAVQSREADLRRLEAELTRLEVERANDERRLEASQRLREIARREFARIERLVEESGAESQARLDSARSALEREEQAVIDGENALALYESRQLSTEAQVAAARSMLDQARLDLERTSVRAPFTGRVREKNVEIGQKVNSGAEVLTLADDRILEVPVSLDSREVARWLDVEADPDEVHWFARFEEYPVYVRWTEVADARAYQGVLDRVENYDSRSRTFHIVARIESSGGYSGEDMVQFPLTEGMFTEVEIPGRVAHNVVAVPREAIDSQGNVYISRDDRLETRAVTVARIQDNIALISRGVEEGELVLLRRPPLVIEGMALEVTVEPRMDEYLDEATASEEMAAQLP